MAPQGFVNEGRGKKRKGKCRKLYNGGRGGNTISDGKGYMLVGKRRQGGEKKD